MRFLLITLIFSITLTHIIVALPLNNTEEHGTVPPATEDPEFSSDEFEGDMVSFSVNPNIPGGMNTAVSDENTRWKYGVVPYVIDDQYSLDEIMVMNTAFNSFFEKTCVRFVPKCDKNDSVKFLGCDGPDFIHIEPGSSCSSMVGRQGGRQPVTLKKKSSESEQGCFITGEPGKVMHELLHALGFIHEQTRMDRDQFVDVDFSNIQTKYLVNFQTYKLKTDSFGEPYDYESVMHYPRRSFAIDKKKDTVTPKGDQEIGQRRDLSPIDVRKINKAYEKECADRLKQPGGDSM